MSYTQLRTPNLTIQDAAGYCLRFTRRVWDVPAYYQKAIDAWNAGTKHLGQPPTDVSVVVYWTYIEGGIQYGHIATSVPGKGIYSSPFDKLYGSQWFSSIDAVTARIRKLDPTAKYLGWSNELSKVQLVKENSMEKVNLNTARIFAEKILGRDRNKTHAGAYDADLKNHLGRDLTNAYVYSLWTSPEANAAAAKIYADQEKITKLTAQNVSLTQENTQLKAQLALQSEDTQLLNSFGEVVKKLLVRWGIK